MEHNSLITTTRAFLREQSENLDEAKMNSVQSVVGKITDLFDILAELVVVRNSTLERVMGPETKQYATELKELKDHLIAAEKVFYAIAQDTDAPM